jgi:hypothetical protein
MTLTKERCAWFLVIGLLLASNAVSLWAVAHYRYRERDISGSLYRLVEPGMVEAQVVSIMDREGRPISEAEIKRLRRIEGPPYSIIATDIHHSKTWPVPGTGFIIVDFNAKNEVVGRRYSVGNLF